MAEQDLADRRRDLPQEITMLANAWRDHPETIPEGVTVDLAGADHVEGEPADLKPYLRAAAQHIAPDWDIEIGDTVHKQPMISTGRHKSEAADAA